MGVSKEDWIQKIHADRKARAEDAAKQEPEAAAQRKYFEANIGPLWDSIVPELRSAVERYNKGLADQRLAVIAKVDLGTRTFSAQKTVFPAGYLDCAPAADGTMIQCVYRFVVEPGASDSHGANLTVERREGGLGVVGCQTAEDVAKAILSPYFVSIG
jgi:hypothetical protein